MTKILSPKEAAAGFDEVELEAARLRINRAIQNKRGPFLTFLVSAFPSNIWAKLIGEMHTDGWLATYVTDSRDGDYYEFKSRSK